VWLLSRIADYVSRVKKLGKRRKREEFMHPSASSHYIAAAALFAASHKAPTHLPWRGAGQMV